MTNSARHQDKIKWSPDILGQDFYATTLHLGDDPDGEDKVIATLVAYKPETPGFDQRPALLWVHGMTDYFFETHVAAHYHDKGYAFYAIDLRKCGRSHQEGERWHYVSDLSLYFHDLNTALETIPNQSVIPMAHSEGGLISTLWLSNHRPKKVTGLILNGPWLDMMGVSQSVYDKASPFFKAAGKLFPYVAFPGGNLTAFGDSMHVSRYGEWDFDLSLKPLNGHKKYLGWLRAVLLGFDQIHAGNLDVGVPYLTICSTHSLLGVPYKEAINYADAVVDVNQTIRWAPTLGKECTLVPIYGARHEAFTSREPIRSQVFDVTDKWLQEMNQQ